MRLKYLSFISAVLLPSLAFASDAGRVAMPFSVIDVNPVAAGMGGCSFLSRSSTAWAAFDNPSLVTANPEKFSASASYVRWRADGKNIMSSGVSYAFTEKIGASAGFSYGHEAEFATSDIQASAGVSWKINDFLNIGASGKYLYEKLSASNRYRAFAADVMMTGGKGCLKFAAGVKSVGTKVKDQSGTGYSLPSRAIAAVGYVKDFSGRHALDLEADLNCFFSGAVSASVGASYTFARLISLRTGYHYGGKSVLPDFLSVGLGLEYSGFALNLSCCVAGNESLRGSVAFGLSYGF